MAQHAHTDFSDVHHKHACMHGQTNRIIQVGIAHAMGGARHPSQKEPPSKEVAVQVGSASACVAIAYG